MPLYRGNLSLSEDGEGNPEETDDLLNILFFGRVGGEGSVETIRGTPEMAKR